MAGGYFTTQDKVIPGAYINFTTDAQNNILSSQRGIVTMPLSLKFGAVRSFILVDNKTDFSSILGYDISNPELLLIKEALKRAKYLLLYRINTGTKAEKTINGLTITAKHEGSRGNDISVSITANADLEGSFNVKTYLSGKEVDLQHASTIGELKENNFVDFSGDGATSLPASVGIGLSGGTDIEALSEDYTTYLNALEVQDFNVIGLPVNDTVVKGIATNFVKRMIEQEGKKIQLVVADYSSANHEGVISVENGVKLIDGTIVNKLNAVAWVSGATAAALVNEDITYSAYEDAVDVDTRYTNTQIEKMINEGKFFFVPKMFNGVTRVVVQEDINTFVGYTNEKEREFHWNRSVRTMFDIGTTIPQLWEERYIGKIDADDDGLNAFKGDLINYFTNLQQMKAIRNFDDKTDINVKLNADTAIAEIAVQVVKAFKKLYMTVKLK